MLRATQTGTVPRPFRRGSFRPPQMAFSVVAALLFLTAGCRTPTPLPPIDIAGPDWTSLSGQALWKPKSDAPELAGELLVATHAAGQSVVHFTKTPFPIAVARITPNRWQVEFPAEDKRYGGRGQGPARLVWLHLPAVLRGEPPPKPWTVSRPGFDRWRLESPRGETLEAVFDLPRPPRHTLQKGESLPWVARWYSVPLSDLLLANPGLDPSRLEPGDTLRLPPP